ncbi:MAG: LUD domain-containing protein [Hymenobacter sp.]|nr:LUD domain-containing protein [Hymenobacter sp.]
MASPTPRRSTCGPWRGSCPRPPSKASANGISNRRSNAKLRFCARAERVFGTAPLAPTRATRFARAPSRSLALLLISLSPLSTSREQILAATRANKPAETLLPTVPDFAGDASVERFTQVLTSIGGQAIWLDGPDQLAPVLTQLFPDSRLCASPLFLATVAVDARTPTDVLADVDLAVLPGEFGVAENGAIWLPEANMLHRALPTITQHLVLVLDHRRIVATMHQAYARLPCTGDYGAFVAGPSKTADIEQSLVIGAHGARSLIVLLY